MAKSESKSIHNWRRYRSSNCYKIVKLHAVLNLALSYGAIWCHRWNRNMGPQLQSLMCTTAPKIFGKISPVGDWRSTSLELPWPWPWFRPYGIPSWISHRPLPTYQISLRSEEKLFWKSPLRFRVTWHKN